MWPYRLTARRNLTHTACFRNPHRHAMMGAEHPLSMTPRQTRDWEWNSVVT